MDAMFGGFKDSPTNQKHSLLNKSSGSNMDNLKIYNNNDNADDIIDDYDWGDEL